MAFLLLLVMLTACAATPQGKNKKEKGKFST